MCFVTLESSKTNAVVKGREKQQQKQQNQAPVRRGPLKKVDLRHFPLKENQDYKNLGFQVSEMIQKSRPVCSFH